MTPTILIVRGLRDHVPGHWQTLLAEQVPGARSVPTFGAAYPDCIDRVVALDRAFAEIAGPVTLVAHSGGVITVAHWARLYSASANALHSALLAVPPDFERPLPAGYPSMDTLLENDWLPVPRARLPFRSIVAASSNDPLGRLDRVLELAADWGSEVINLGSVGHLNPASGYGPWPEAKSLIARLAQKEVQHG